MDRYSKYFLQHILYLDDGFNKYYVQDKAWGRQEILDVESVIFDWAEDAEQWLGRCADYDRYETVSHLRSFLANDCPERHLVHLMNDRQVMQIVARQIAQNFYQIVIKPRLGWAVQVDADSAKPVLPLSVEPVPDLDALLAGLKTELDDLVAEQQKQYDEYEAQMRGMNAAQKALFIKQQMDGAAYDTAIGDNLDLIKAAPGAIWSAAKAFPGFYKGYLKFMWKIAQLPSKMAGFAAQAMATGDINPLKEEIDKIVRPVAATYEEAMEYKSMLTILCNEPEVYELLYDFADRYYEATHPIELAKMGASAVTEVLITVLLAIFTAGAGAAANIAAKSGKLVKVFNLLKKITTTIKKISPNPKLLDRSKNATDKAKKASKATTKSAKGMPDVESPKRAEKIDKTAKKEYGDDKKDGLKTETETGKTSSTTDGLASGTSGPPMDPAKFERIKKSFESKGGVIDQSDDAEAYLKMRGAEGLTLNEKTILLPKDANTSAVYEELIHSSQFRKGIATSSNVNEMEIQAAEKLIKNRKAYKIPNSETRQTIERLRQYRGQQ